MSRHILIHTDGACIGNPGPGGWGVVLQLMDGATIVKRKCISGGTPDTTNNRMEMTAAIKALEALKPSDIPVIIRSDSNILIQGMNSWRHNWKAKGWRKSDRKPVENQDLWEKLDALDAPRIKWEWVKGHAGNALNEEADRLASKAANRLI